MYLLFLLNLIQLSVVYFIIIKRFFICHTCINDMKTKWIVIFLKSQHFYLINNATYSQAMKESITVSILSRDGQIPVNLISTAEVIFCWWWVSHCFTASFIDMAFHILKKFQNPGGYYPTGSACLESIQSIWLPEKVVGFMEKIARYIVIYGRRCSFWMKLCPGSSLKLYWAVQRASLPQLCVGWIVTK